MIIGVFMKKYKFFILVLLIFPFLSLHSEEKGIDFQDPEPYIDYEFEELQKTYLKNRKIQFAALKKLPLNQYPEEFILDLINEIKNQVKKEIQKDIKKFLQKNKLLRKFRKRYRRSYIKRMRENVRKRKKRNNIITMDPKRTKRIRERNLRKKRKNIWFERRKKRKSQKKKQYIRKKTKKRRIKNRKIRKKLNFRKQKKSKSMIEESSSNRIILFSVNNNTPFIGINRMSKTRIVVSVRASNSVKNVDISVFMRNIDSNRSYLIKRFAMRPISKRRSDSFVYKYPSIPFGKYKPFVIAKFYNRRKKMVDKKIQNWGNSSSKRIYIILKN